MKNDIFGSVPLNPNGGSSGWRWVVTAPTCRPSTRIVWRKSMTSRIGTVLGRIAVAARDDVLLEQELGVDAQVGRPTDRLGERRLRARAARTDPGRARGPATSRPVSRAALQRSSHLLPRGRARRDLWRGDHDDDAGPGAGDDPRPHRGATSVVARDADDVTLGIGEQGVRDARDARRGKDHRRTEPLVRWPARPGRSRPRRRRSRGRVRGPARSRPGCRRRRRCRCTCSRVRRPGRTSSRTARRRSAAPRRRRWPGSRSGRLGDPSLEPPGDMGRGHRDRTRRCQDDERIHAKSTARRRSPRDQARFASRCWRRSWAASSISLWRHSAARNWQAIRPIRWIRRKSP